MTDDQNQFPVVGIGASAGGIPAMEGLFKRLPADPDAAFVIVTHLSPERESMLHEVVERYTSLPVMIAEDDVLVEPNHIYVMPSNAILTIKERRLRLRRPDAANRERKPIDIFLSSLAEDQGEYAVAASLSGGDGDGTLGAKAVKERGGFTMAQASDGSAPRNPGMPESAIASGMIDVACPVEQMGEKIVAFGRSFGTLAALADNAEDREEAGLQQARTEIYGILRSYSGHDFSGYKPKTFMRRIGRRMQVLQLQSIHAYVDLLKRESAEVMNLFRDLLINVTAFFRDAGAFEVLEKVVIPRLFEGRGAGDTVRVWVPGCATGEEVYSLAILMREHIDTLAAPPRVQIFATDIDDSALTIARSGRYPEQLLDGVSAERKQRFFRGDGASFVIAAEARELCIFSPHSVIKDPPFSRMDLVSCRNLLIYFGPEIQNRVIPTFHYSLKPGGYLFLGTSESISQHGELFATVDKKSRIFQSREHASSPPRLPLLVGDPRIVTPDQPGRGSARLASYSMRQAVEAHVLDRFSPAHVVVNGEGDVVYYSGRTGRYLEAPQGAPSRQILTMVRKSLRLDLRAALREAMTRRETAVRRDIPLDDEENRVQPTTLTVEPLPDRGAGEALYLILFDPAGPADQRAEPGNEDRATHENADLERELRDTRERLQSTIEEYETALEELKSSNEELVSVNEEAQSTNEELEASKEEMQSLNEELNTINTELSAKVEDLDRANNDLRNLFESTRIATVFLDRKLVIRNFTPAASSFFNLRSADVGRPLTDLSTKLDYPELKEHIASVFRLGSMVEHQLPRDSEGRHYLVRLIPYRSEAGGTDGVVVTFVDVTSLAEAEEHQQILISELNHRVKNMLAVVISVANHTLQKTPSPEDFVAALTGRLHAMARAYELLSRTNWKEASVAELVRQETESLGEARFSAAGPEVHLKPHQGLAIGMVLHELATNASKYGALSGPDGSVGISWDVSEGRFRLQWEERDGPAVERPNPDGFGLQLVRGEIEYRLNGRVETVFDPKGLKATLSFPLEDQ